MRLSRGRVLLRVLLLAGGGTFMLWRAWRARGLSRLLRGPDAALEGRLALVWALVGALALLTALGTLLALRPRLRRHTLRLGDRSPPGIRRPGA